MLCVGYGDERTQSVRKTFPRGAWERVKMSLKWREYHDETMVDFVVTDFVGGGMR